MILVIIEAPTVNGLFENGCLVADYGLSCSSSNQPAPHNTKPGGTQSPSRSNFRNLNPWMLSPQNEIYIYIHTHIFCLAMGCWDMGLLQVFNKCSLQKCPNNPVEHKPCKAANIQIHGKLSRSLARYPRQVPLFLGTQG